MEFKLKQFNIIPRRRGWILLLLSIVSLSFFIPTLALADYGTAVAQIMSTAILSIVNFLVGWLFTFEIETLVKVAQYNNFINSPAVSKGWIIIRDLFNILFVIVLLVIAFATVLKLEKYHYKRMLASFLIAAVLVNFSKLICGILIDITQVMMLTFVNAFKDTASGNFIEMLGLTRLLSMNAAGAEEIGAASILGATLLALIMAIISIVVIGIILFVLLFRIIMIWILVILSPLAFIAMVLPATQGYGRQWWQKFTNQLIIGPILAFFLWLSLAMVQDPGTDPNSLYQKEAPVERGTTEESLEKLTEASQPQYMLNFVMGIAMLVGSLMVTQQLGVAGAGIAGKAVTKMQGMATGLVKGTTKLGFKGADRILEKGSKLVGGALGAKDFKGISYDIAKTAWQKRKIIKDKRRADTVGEAAAPLAVALDRALDPGVLSKTLGDKLTGAKGKMKIAVQKKVKIKIDIEAKDKDIEKENNKLDQLNQEKVDNTFLKDQLSAGTDKAQVKPGMTQTQIDQEMKKIEPLQNNLRKAAEEAAEGTGKHWSEEYNWNTKTGRAALETYLEDKTLDADRQINSSDKSVSQLEDEKEALIDQSNEQSTKISDLRYRPYLGIKERKRPGLVELDARKRQAEESNDLILTTGGDEDMLIEEIKKALALGHSGKDKAIAAIELLVKVNGQNKALEDPTIQALIRKKIKVKFPKTNDQGKNLAIEDFNKNPVSLPAWQMFLEHTFKDVAHYNDYEATRGIARVGSIGTMAGNPALAGMAKFDSLTGLPELGGIIQKQDGGLDMDKAWAKIGVAKMHQLEAQAFWRMVHSDAFVTEDRQGNGYNLHATGKEFLKELDAKDITHMGRIRGDTLTRLTSKRVLKQIDDFVDQIAQGKIKDVDKQQATIITAFKKNLIKLKG